jgi:hypothetical protein
MPITDTTRRYTPLYLCTPLINKVLLPILYGKPHLNVAKKSFSDTKIQEKADLSNVIHIKVQKTEKNRQQ